MSDDHILLSDLDWPCVCGHRHPEHTIAGPCRGCLVCTIDENSDHSFARCDCEAYVRSEAGVPMLEPFPMAQ